MKKEGEAKTFKIRRVTKKDVKEIIPIWRDEFRKAPWNENWTKDKIIKTLKNFLSRGRAYVAIKDKKIVGFITLTEDYYLEGQTAYVEKLSVSKKFQGQGIGVALLNKVEEDYKKRGFVKLYVETVKKSLAYRLYKHKNYKDSIYDVLVEKKLK
jgi:ribosomal protein S18 acetylase RimI-like enzyme